MLQYAGEAFTRGVNVVASALAFIAMYIFPKLSQQFTPDVLRDLFAASIMLPFSMAFQVASSVYHGAGRGIATALRQPGMVLNQWQKALMEKPEVSSEQSAPPALMQQQRANPIVLLCTAQVLHRFLEQKRQGRIAAPPQVSLQPELPQPESVVAPTTAAEQAEPTAAKKRKKVRRRKKSHAKTDASQVQAPRP